MQDAIRLYRRIGFEREPEHDFETQAGVLVMGFRLELTSAVDINRTDPYSTGGADT